MKSNRLYRVDHTENEGVMLVRATNKEQALRHATRKTLEVAVATDQDIYDLAKLGVQIEDAAGGEGTT